MPARMRLITVHLPEKWIEFMDMMVAEGLYPNRSEIIRLALRDFLRRHLEEEARKLRRSEE